MAAANSNNNFETYSTETDTPQNEDGKSFKFPPPQAHEIDSDDQSFIFPSHSTHQGKSLIKTIQTAAAASAGAIEQFEPSLTGTATSTTCELMKLHFGNELNNTEN